MYASLLPRFIFALLWTFKALFSPLLGLTAQYAKARTWFSRLDTPRYYTLLISLVYLATTNK